MSDVSVPPTHPDDELVTRRILREEIAKLATKDELAKTHEKLETLATKDELAKLATKDELAKTHEKLETLATKDELAKTNERLETLATKDELAKTNEKLEIWFGALHARLLALESRWDELATLVREMPAEFARQTKAIIEHLRDSVRIVDEKYADLPARVTRLEEAK